VKYLLDFTSKISALGFVTIKTLFREDGTEGGLEAIEKCIIVFLFFKIYFWCAPFGYLNSFSFIVNVTANFAYIHSGYSGIQTHVLLDVSRLP
jgi:hypothetical protein